MKMYDILTKWILKTHSMWEKGIQIMYSSIHIKNQSNMHQTYRFHGSASGGISPLRPYYSRDYRSTSHMKASLAKDRCFSSGPGVCFRVFLRCQEGFSDLWKIMIFHHVWVKKIVHEPKPLPRQCSAHILWKLMKVEPNESSTRVLCGKNRYRFCTAQ